MARTIALTSSSPPAPSAAAARNPPPPPQGNLPPPPPGGAPPAPRGEREGERRPLARFRGHPDRPPMPLHDTADRRQPQTAADELRREERLRNPRHPFRTHSR